MNDWIFYIIINAFIKRDAYRIILLQGREYKQNRRGKMKKKGEIKKRNSSNKYNLLNIIITMH